MGVKITERDIHTGIEETVYEDDERVTFAQSQDVTPVLETNIAQAKETSRLHKRREELRQVLRTPQIVLTKLFYEEGLNYLDPEHACIIEKRFLTDPDYKKFRTHV